MPKFKIFKDLKRIMGRHYLLPKVTRPLGRKVAWVTSGAPVEPLVALGITPMYPENHGAICGARRVAGENHALAEAAGYNAEICSYARNDIGAQMGGPSPVGHLAKPHMVVACNNICNTVTKWFERTAEIQGVPFYLIDTPMIHDRLEDHTVAYVKSQLEGMAEWAEKITGKRLTDKKLRATADHAQDNVDAWTEVLSMNVGGPALFSCFDAFVFMMPIVSMRGTATVTAFFQKLKRELEERRDAGQFLLKNEQKRLIWDNIPIWFQIGPLSKFFASHDTALVADTYTHAWAGHQFARDDLFEGAARAYTDIYLNQSMPFRADRVEWMLDRFAADGFVMHSNRSCKPYSIGEYPVKEEVTRRTGKPGVVIEGDMTDPRLYSESQSIQRLQALVESL
jgi:benzoyl-CoA reductase/2-hydroxyglutaryl-CoA dehydratase subunit BcrC/BadD/HgdB